MMLQKYVDMVRRNVVFSTLEVQDFYKLSELLVQERSDDKGAWSIFMFATIIRTLYRINIIERQNKNEKLFLISFLI